MEKYQIQIKAVRMELCLCLTCAFLPESSDKLYSKGRSSDSLHRLWPSHPPRRTVAIEDTKGFLKKLTASGNVQDLHLVPYYLRFLSGDLCWGKCRM